MTCVKNVDFGFRYVLTIAFRLTGLEREIILPPKDEQARLLLAHPSLPLRVCVHVRSIVVEKIALNLRLSRLIQEVKLVGPQIRIITLHIRIVPDMARPRRLQRQEICAERVFIGGAIFPKFPPRFPIRAQTFVVRDRILNNERIYALGMRKRHAETDWAAVILHVKCVTRESERFGEVIHDFGNVIERVGEFFRIRPVAVSESRIIRRDQVISIGKPGEKWLEHSR